MNLESRAPDPSFSSLADQISSLVLITDLDHCIEYANPAILNTYHVSLKSIIGKKPGNIFVEDFLRVQAHNNLRADLAEHGKWSGYLYNITSRAEVIVEKANINLTRDDGAPMGYLKIGENVTLTHKQNQWRDQLIESRKVFVHPVKGYRHFERNLTKLFSRDQFFPVPLNFIFLPCSEDNLELKPYTNIQRLQGDFDSHAASEERIYSIPPSLGISIAPQEITDLTESVLFNLPAISLFFKNKSGEIMAAPVSAGGTTYGALICFHLWPVKYLTLNDQNELSNLTDTIGDALNTWERRRLVQYQQKSESISRMAALVAHEVRNPLAIISTGVEALVRDLDLNVPRTKKLLDNIYSSLERATGTLQDLMSLSQKMIEEKAISQVDLYREIMNVISTLAEEIDRRKIELQVSIEPGTTVLATEETLFTIFSNLIMNSCRAIEKEGCIKIWMLDHNNGQIHVMVQDTGSGIPEKIASKIFEPFFTTRKKRAGHGMGLNYVHGLMTMLKGDISVSNNQDEQGATFRLTFNSGQEAIDV
ncbi:MAG: PAS domain-containing sensor histidine kinase [FCB group bacterium]|nr:PAS domain-containing sensor histidine kinase [FCB group bacterium]